jgi:uncharacterized protein with NRDE domain
MFSALADRRLADDNALPDTGVPIEWERLLSAVFISGTDYGTRASTLMAIGADGSAWLEERGFGTEGRPLDVHRFEFQIPRAG